MRLFIDVSNTADHDDETSLRTRVSTNKVSDFRNSRNSMIQMIADNVNRGLFGMPSYSERFQVRTEISSELESEFESVFTRYLQNLCNNPDQLPDDCLDLLRNMMNVSIRHSFTSEEVDALAQRVEYLMSVVPQTLPYLFIQFSVLLFHFHLESAVLKLVFYLISLYC